MKKHGLAWLCGLLLAGGACAPDTVTAPASAPAATVIRDGEGREVRQPLFVVDGRMLSADETGRINPGDINPGDILDVKVLKGDRAVQVYGAQGANGVVVVTTKHAGAGG